jgi:hypothetical protein
MFLFFSSLFCLFTPLALLPTPVAAPASRWLASADSDDEAEADRAGPSKGPSRGQARGAGGSNGPAGEGGTGRQGSPLAPDQAPGVGTAAGPGGLRSSDIDEPPEAGASEARIVPPEAAALQL